MITTSPLFHTTYLLFMELNFRGGCYSCVTVIIRGFNFHTLASAVKINPLVTVKGDHCFHMWAKSYTYI